ncbi:helix-turn-helix domain-containing protein [Geomicrobium sp. JSM 1781026]|uniref:helix-turn-helix domain-containing protein n=1 Tax=Geomicrobium sp. JSM 1781026 TaxID=3344580 RepID=UPI0035BF9B8F
MKITGSKSVFNKKERTEDEYFIKLPSDIAHYMYVPGISARHTFLYAMIVDYYNPDYGYAWPSYIKLATDLNRSTQTVGQDLRKLYDAGLIEIIKVPSKDYNRYVPYKPLTQGELWLACPEAGENYRAKIKQLDEERSRDHEKLRQLRTTYP